LDKYIIENEEIFLKSELKEYPFKVAEDKFDHSGKPLPFTGCSIICKIPIKSDLFFELKSLQLKYKDLSPEKAYTYLPETSFHMTLFDCCNENTINTQYWPKNIEPDYNYKKTAYVLSKRIKKYIFPEKFDLKVKTLFGGYSIILEGNTEKDEKIIRECRNKLSDLLGIRFENHDTYIFHITLAYILRKLKDNEIEKIIKTNSRLLEGFVQKFPLIRVEKPVLCTFENMYEFKST
jgi:hypothetical protein|tara:strand:- start:227 stop:931 length:705 start_codon:yes stop_codon:yes gene_type:complete